MNRPSRIDIPNTTNSRSASSTGTLQTPRIQHYDGEIPPVLSPLDAFAAESRRLAKELEATRIAGERRLSRLPPAVITKTLTQHNANRPACFRSLSGNNDPPPLPRPDAFAAANSPELTEPLQRPKSSHPRISAVPKDGEDDPAHYSDLFPIPRTQSPTFLSERPLNIVRNAEKLHPTSPAGLAPPNAPFAKSKQSHESSDDEYTSSNAGSTFSQPLPRKYSNSSGTSFPASPALPYHERTPSTKSNDSLASLKKSLPNFSRPISQSSLQIDSPPRKTNRSPGRNLSQLLEARDIPSFEDARSDGYMTGRGSSYTHKRFVLPRGKQKTSTRVSQLFSGLSASGFQWQEPMFPGTPPLSARTDDSLPQTNSPALRSSSESNQSPAPSRFVLDRPTPKPIEERPSSARSLQEHTKQTDSSLQRPSTSHGSSQQNFNFFDRSFIPALPPIPGSTADDLSIRTSHKTEESQSTIRPTTARTDSDYQALTVDEHVEKAINLHQTGDLKASTYHLRIAAKQDHPTGMLLFALACRHGWGMRANPAEGVALLRKAVDISMLEVAEDENTSNHRDNVDKKSHRAQFALGIYELGISHLNGWGVEQDKALALRCFEIAGDWGDADALTEAGFCYAEGVGCKKNLRKAAKFYRRAADKGVSMVGNSWIYKTKYDDEEPAEETRTRRPTVVDDKEKGSKTRSKSKSRSLFGRKRVNASKESPAPALVADARYAID